MDVVTDDFDGHRGRIEVFELQLPHPTAVHGVGPLGVEGFNVEMFRPFAHLFIRREGHPDIAMGNIFTFQHRQRGHDLGDARLVISTEQGFTVGGDQRLSQQGVEYREHHRRQHFVSNPQRNIPAAVVFNDLRVHVFAAKIRRGINMGDKANRRNIAGNIGQQRAHYRTFVA